MTNDLERRINQHNDGHKKDAYTFDKRPLKLEWNLQCTNPQEAIKIEKQIKGWTHKKKQALIEGNWDDLILFSKNYTEFGKPT
jgi:putative endonuclease